MIWQQNYDPAGNIWLSAIIAVIPIVLFFVLLAGLKVKGWLAGTLTVLTALIVAIFFYGMPFSHAIAATVYGFLFGLWPIAWIIIAAVFLYNISVKTGQMEVMRKSVTSLTSDQRLQMLLIAFCFSAFLEGAAGFGAPVAIAAGLLVGLGFQPMYAATLCLVANSAPVAFGAIGIPVIVAGQVTNIPPLDVGAMVGRQLPFLVVIVVFTLVAIMDGWRGLKETWPALLVTGVSFAVMQFLVSNFIGPELPDIASAVVSIIALGLFLRVWQPASIFRFSEADGGVTHVPPDAPELASNADNMTTKKVVGAWSPFIVLSIIIAIWSIPPFKQLFSDGGSLHNWIIQVPVPYLDNLVQKMPPIVAQATDYAAVYKWDWFSATGTAILIAALITLFISRVKPSTALSVAGDTLRQLAVPTYLIGTVLAFAFIMNYSGESVTLALALSQTGHAFTFLSPILGWIGVFLTGSDTSSNALFAALQAAAAGQIHVPEVLLVGANSSGGVVGKMISPQSIAIGAAAVGLAGRESELLRATLKYSLFFLLFVAILTTLQAYVLPWMIPMV